MPESLKLNQRIPKITEQQKKQAEIVQTKRINNIHFFDVRIMPETYMKLWSSIILLDEFKIVEESYTYISTSDYKQLSTNYLNCFNFLFHDIDDSLILSSRVIPYFSWNKSANFTYVYDGKPYTFTDFMYGGSNGREEISGINFNYNWERVDNINARLYITCRSSGKQVYEVSMYMNLTLKLFFYNPYSYKTI